MAKNKLTTRQIGAAELEPGRREQLLADGDGLFLLLRPNGKTWRFEYRFAGQKRRMDLGAFPLHTLNEARAWADDQRRLIDLGTDPKRERDTKVGPVTNKTVGALLDTYRDSLIGRASHRQTANILKNHVPDALRRLPLVTVEKADLVAPIRKLAEAGKRRTAGLLHSYIVRAFSLAHEAAENVDSPSAFLPFDMKKNPVAGMKVVEGATGETHEQVMTLAQLREYATLLHREPPSPARDVLMLSLYCGGQRLAQVARGTMLPDNVMLTWDIKGKFGYLNPRRHALPLIGPVADTKPPALTDEHDVANLCDSATNIIEKISGDAYTQIVIRRTLENLLLDADFSTLDTAILLSHGRSGVQHKHYVRGDRLDLKARMIRVLHGILDSANVVPLHSAA